MVSACARSNVVCLSLAYARYASLIMHGFCNKLGWFHQIVPWYKDAQACPCRGLGRHLGRLGLVKDFVRLQTTKSTRRALQEGFSIRTEGFCLLGSSRCEVSWSPQLESDAEIRRSNLTWCWGGLWARPRYMQSRTDVQLRLENSHLKGASSSQTNCGRGYPHQLV